MGRIQGIETVDEDVVAVERDVLLGDDRLGEQGFPARKYTHGPLDKGMVAAGDAAFAPRIDDGLRGVRDDHGDAQGFVGPGPRPRGADTDPPVGRQVAPVGVIEMGESLLDAGFGERQRRVPRVRAGGDVVLEFRQLDERGEHDAEDPGCHHGDDQRAASLAFPRSKPHLHYCWLRRTILEEWTVSVFDVTSMMLRVQIQESSMILAVLAVATGYWSKVPATVFRW